MAGRMIQEMGQDRGLRTYTPYKRPSLIQALFGKISTEIDVGRTAGSTNVHYKLRAGMKKRMNKRVDAGMPGRI